MYQKIIVPIDHGNRNMKTEHKIFTSGFVEGDCRPALGEYLHFGGRYYALAEQRIPYMRDMFLFPWSMGTIILWYIAVISFIRENA